MSKKQITLLWSCQICLYMANIILTFATGGTLATCILGWLVAILLAGFIIYLQFRLVDKDSTIDALDKAFDDTIRNADYWHKEWLKERNKVAEYYKRYGALDSQNQAKDGKKK